MWRFSTSNTALNKKYWKNNYVDELTPMHSRFWNRRKGI